VVCYYFFTRFWCGKGKMTVYVFFRGDDCKTDL
jgi:hypothetical protein